MLSKGQSRTGASPPDRARRAARVTVLVALSAATGILVGTHGGTHVTAAVGITLALFPTLLRLVPAATPRNAHVMLDGTPPADPTPAPMPVPSSETSLAQGAFQPTAEHPADQEEEHIRQVHHLKLPEQRTTTAPAGTANELYFGTITPPPVSVRMTVRPVLHLTTDIYPIITIEQHLPAAADHESA